MLGHTPLLRLIQPATIAAVLGVSFLAGAVAGCDGRPDSQRTATIEAADPRPSPTPPYPQAGPVITTAGSPRPTEHIVATQEAVSIADGTLQMRPLIPAKTTAFRVRNKGVSVHSLRIAGAGINASLDSPLSAGEEIVLQVNLPAGRYVASCTMPGHNETTEFTAYVPGAPIRR